jgi:hypothetical protein
VERLEDCTLLVVTIDLDPQNLSGPAHCANQDSQFEFVMLTQLDQPGAPIFENVTLRYMASGNTCESVVSPLCVALGTGQSVGPVLRIPAPFPGCQFGWQCAGSSACNTLSVGSFQAGNQSASAAPVHVCRP